MARRANLATLWHRTHPERLELIKEHGLRKPAFTDPRMPRVPVSAERQRIDSFIDSFAPKGIVQRRTDGIFLFTENFTMNRGAEDKRTGIKVRVNPKNCRVFDQISCDSVCKNLRMNRMEQAQMDAWAYWHFSVPLEDFLQHYERGKGLANWTRKPNAPQDFPEMFYIPEVITMKEIPKSRVSTKPKQKRK